MVMQATSSNSAGLDPDQRLDLLRLEAKLTQGVLQLHKSTLCNDKEVMTRLLTGNSALAQVIYELARFVESIGDAREDS